MRCQLLLFLLAIITPSCYVRFNASVGNFEEDKRRARQAIDEFHVHYNANNYDEIISNAHAAFTSQQGKEGVLLALRQAFERFGQHRDVAEATLNVIFGAPV